MPTNELLVSTPRYVLMDGSHRLGPQVVPLDSGLECSVIYGFSGKGAYDRFRGNSNLAVKPYPLVKGYLQNQVRDAAGDLKLVVLDAEGPGERCLHAVTMQSVLEAQENRIDHLTTAYQLILDPQADAYRLQMKEDAV